MAPKKNDGDLLKQLDRLLSRPGVYHSRSLHKYGLVFKFSKNASKSQVDRQKQEAADSLNELLTNYIKPGRNNPKDRKKVEEIVDELNAGQSQTLATTKFDENKPFHIARSGAGRLFLHQDNFVVEVTRSGNKLTEKPHPSQKKPPNLDKIKNKLSELESFIAQSGDFENVSADQIVRKYEAQFKTKKGTTPIDFTKPIRVSRKGDVFQLEDSNANVVAFTYSGKGVFKQVAQPKQAAAPRAPKRNSGGGNTGGGGNPNNPFNIGPATPFPGANAGPGPTVAPSSGGGIPSGGSTVVPPKQHSSAKKGHSISFKQLAINARATNPSSPGTQSVSPEVFKRRISAMFDLKSLYTLALSQFQKRQDDLPLLLGGSEPNRVIDQFDSIFEGVLTSARDSKDAEQVEKYVKYLLNVGKLKDKAIRRDVHRAPYPQEHEAYMNEQFETVLLTLERDIAIRKSYRVRIKNRLNKAKGFFKKLPSIGSIAKGLAGEDPFAEAIFEAGEKIKERFFEKEPDDSKQFNEQFERDKDTLRDKQRQSRRKIITNFFMGKGGGPSLRGFGAALGTPPPFYNAPMSNAATVNYQRINPSMGTPGGLGGGGDAINLMVKHLASIDRNIELLLAEQLRSHKEAVIRDGAGRLNAVEQSRDALGGSGTPGESAFRKAVKGPGLFASIFGGGAAAGADGAPASGGGTGMFKSIADWVAGAAGLTWLVSKTKGLGGLLMRGMGGIGNGLKGLFNFGKGGASWLGRGAANLFGKVGGLSGIAGGAAKLFNFLPAIQQGWNLGMGMAFNKENAREYGTGRGAALASDTLNAFASPLSWLLPKSIIGTPGSTARTLSDIASNPISFTKIGLGLGNQADFQAVMRSRQDKKIDMLRETLKQETENYDKAKTSGALSPGVQGAYTSDAVALAEQQKRDKIIELTKKVLELELKRDMENNTSSNSLIADAQRAGAKQGWWGKLKKFVTGGIMGSSGKYTAANKSGKDDPKLVEFANKYAKEFGIDANLIMAVAQTESGGNLNQGQTRVDRNKDGVPDSSAYGPMQIIKGTAKMLGINQYDPEENIKGGAKYLSQLMKQKGSMEGALASYGEGPAYANKVMAEYNRRKNLAEQTESLKVANDANRVLASGGQNMTMINAPQTMVQGGSGGGGMMTPISPKSRNNENAYNNLTEMMWRSST